MCGMRKVVDSNYVRSDRLHQYLSKTAKNCVVLTDYAAMEAYKGDTLASIYRSMEILSQFPKQVIVLKGTQAVCGLRGRRAGLQRRLIDGGQTQGFRKYCRNLLAAERGDLRLQKVILDHGHAATVHMERILADVADLPDALRGAADTFTDTEVRILRKGSDLTDEIIDKFVQNILLLAAVLFRDHPRVTKWPDATELPNTFIFRYALCAHLLVFNWIAVGSPPKLKPEKMRNDIVDMSFAAYATFFDGLLTEDKKLQNIYHEASRLLPMLFSVDKV